MNRKTIAIVAIGGVALGGIAAAGVAAASVNASQGDDVEACIAAFEELLPIVDSMQTDYDYFTGDIENRAWVSIGDFADNQADLQAMDMQPCADVAPGLVDFVDHSALGQYHNAEMALAIGQEDFDSATHHLEEANYYTGLAAEAIEVGGRELTEAKFALEN